jgi:hypothetical protein
MRCGWDLKWVEGISKDYIFPTEDDNGKVFIEDYGSISDEGFIELLIKEWDTEDKLFKYHLIKRLAERLNVKLREKPLSDEVIFDNMSERSAKLIKELRERECLKKK